MIETTIAQPAPHSTPEKPPRLRQCAACGKPSGSISAGTGFPVVRERASERYYHVRCRPGSPSGASLAGALLGVAL